MNMPVEERASNIYTLMKKNSEKNDLVFRKGWSYKIHAIP